MLYGARLFHASPIPWKGDPCDTQKCVPLNGRRVAADSPLRFAVAGRAGSTYDRFGRSAPGWVGGAIKD